MKKYLFSIALSFSALLASFRGTAQIYSSSLHAESDWGIKGGANFQEINGSAFAPTYNTGYTAGLYYAKHWHKIALRIEAMVNDAHYTTLHYPTYGKTYEKGYDTTKKGDFNAMYISIPVLAEIKIKKKLWFEIGPQYNYMVSITDNNGAYTKENKNDNIFKKGEVCLDLGLNYQFTHTFNLGVRYMAGITDVNKDTYYRAYDAWTEYAAQVTLSIRL